MHLYEEDIDIRRIGLEVQDLLQKKVRPQYFNTTTFIPHIINIKDLTKIQRRPDNLKTRYSKGYREYLVQGEWYASMTSILSVVKKSEFLIKWETEKAVNRIQEILNEAARVGELVHYQTLDYIGKYMRDDGTFQEDMWQNPPDFLYDSNIMTEEKIEEYRYYLYHAALLFTEFLQIYHKKFKIISIENEVFNRKLGYAGRFDLEFNLWDDIEDRWVHCLGDIKTSASVYENVRTQLTGYNMSEQFNESCERLYELRIHPYPDNEWNYGWEFKRLNHDRQGLIEAVIEFNEQKRQEFVIDNSLFDELEYEEEEEFD